MSLADELWRKHCSYDGRVHYSRFLAALTEAMQAVRKRDAEVCRDKERRKWEIVKGGGLLEGIGPLDCAAAIELEPLP